MSCLKEADIIVLWAVCCQNSADAVLTVSGVQLLETVGSSHSVS